MCRGVFGGGVRARGDARPPDLVGYVHGDCHAWEGTRACRFGDECVYAESANKKY